MANRCKGHLYFMKCDQIVSQLVFAFYILLYCVRVKVSLERKKKNVAALCGIKSFAKFGRLCEGCACLQINERLILPSTVVSALLRE